nr:leucine zipper transcription factor-like protein 1 [Penaeus vannamei]
MGGYLRFTKYQRAQRLRSVDACFQDVKDTRVIDNFVIVSLVIFRISDNFYIGSQTARGDLHVGRSGGAAGLPCRGGAGRGGGRAHPRHAHQLRPPVQRLRAGPEVAPRAHRRHFEPREPRAPRRRPQVRGGGAQGRLGIDKKPRKDPGAARDQEGPTALLHAEIKRLTEENGEVKRRLELAESKVTDLAKTKAEMSLTLQTTSDELGRVRQTISSRPTLEEVSELSDEVEKMRLELSTKVEEKEATQEQLQSDLSLSKQRLAQVKSQLQLAEKELEKKFSQTGAYQNMKKMLGNKNDQIKALRKKLEIYEPSKEDIIEE